MTEPSNLRDAAPAEPLCPFTDRPAWECAAACTCAHFKPTGIIKHAHPPAAPTDALVEKSREWAIVVREADKQWSQPLSTLLEQLATALAAMQEAKP